MRTTVAQRGDGLLTHSPTVRGTSGHGLSVVEAVEALRPAWVRAGQSVLATDPAVRASERAWVVSPRHERPQGRLTGTKGACSSNARDRG